MYANGFDTPKDNCLNGGIWIFLWFRIWEFIFYLEISSFHFLWKKNNQSSQKEDSCSGLL